MRAIHMLLGYVRPHLWAVPLLVVLGLLASAAEGFGIGMLIPLLDVLVRPAQETDAGWFVTAIRGFGASMSSEARLTLLAGTIFGLVVVKSIIMYAYSALAVWFNGRTVHALRCALMRQMLQIGYAFFARADQGRLVNAPIVKPGEPAKRWRRYRSSLSRLQRGGPRHAAATGLVADDDRRSAGRSRRRAADTCCSAAQPSPGHRSRRLLRRPIRADPGGLSRHAGRPTFRPGTGRATAI